MEYKGMDKKIMNNTLKMLIIIVFSTFILANSGCGGGGGGGTDSEPGTVNLIMKISNLASEGISGEESLSPGIYKVAMVNFWLIRDDDTEINLINPDSNNPQYTEDNPLLIDFNDDFLNNLLVSGANLPGGEYTGFRMQILYIEMQFPVYFHLPAICLEDDMAEILGIDIEHFSFEEMDEGMNCNFRLYFNANGKFWKKDFVVNLNFEGFEDEWFWLRREVDGSSSNFFISVTNNDHPSGGSGPESTVDLFSDPLFWGDEADYDDISNPIIISSGSSLGGLNASIEPFTISGGEYNLTVNIDVQNTFGFNDNVDPPELEYTFHDEVLDLGPCTWDEGGGAFEYYGDYGLHPFLPALYVVSEKIS